MNRDGVFSCVCLYTASNKHVFNIYVKFGEVSTIPIFSCISEVIRANAATQHEVRIGIDRIDERMLRHGEQLDTLLTNQTVCMDRQTRK